MPTAKKDSITNQFYLYLSILFLLAISALCLKIYSNPIKVLGASSRDTQIQTNIEYWNSFLIENPNYIPGWIEIGRIDKVMEIDPNYQ